jgi:hypothetical protein
MSLGEWKQKLQGEQAIEYNERVATMVSERFDQMVDNLLNGHVCAFRDAAERKAMEMIESIIAAQMGWKHW